MTVLTADSFNLLLSTLDQENRSNAADKYELLRLKLIKCFVWRKSCPESAAEALADVVLDRLAVKVSQGEQIHNVNAYACTILEFVWKEHLRRHKEDSFESDKVPEQSTELDQSEIFDDPDLRTRCLRKCLAEVVPERQDRRLIVGYYDVEAGEKLKDIRKTLADELGLSMTNLKVRASRIRDRLEKCINECVLRINVTKTSKSVTDI